MLIAVAALLAVVTFMVLTRLLWLNVRPVRGSTAITLLVAVLLISLAILAASGRLSWLAAAGAAVLPFMRRGIGLLRYLPWFRHLFGAFQQHQRTRDEDARGGRTGPQGSDQMTPERALEVLGLSGNPGRDEVIAAHRRLMQKLHPDRGGSTYLAQQLNEAKRVLLKRS